MIRLFYTPDQVGLSKVEAAKLTLENINPRVVLEAFNSDVTSARRLLSLRALRPHVQQDP